MKLCAIETKELEDKVLTRFAENQNDELLEDLSDYVINSQKEIERLNKELDKTRLSELHKEYVINELEKWLKQETIDLYDEDNPLLLDASFAKYATERKMAYMYVLDKLEELKGSDKE